MEGHQSESLALAPLSENGGGSRFREALLKGVDHHVADKVDSISGDALIDQVLVGLSRGGEKEVGERIGDDPVDLLGHGAVPAPETGLDMRDAVTQQKMVKPDVAMQLYAESLGLPYVEVADIGVNEEVAPSVPALIARQHSCVPVMVDDGQLYMASPNPVRPDVEEELRLRLGMPIRSVLCTAAGVNAAIEKYYPKSAAAAEKAAGEAAAPAQSEETATEAKSTAPSNSPAQDAEARKQRAQLIAVLVYAGTVGGVWFAMSSIPLGIGIGMVVAGIVYVVLK